MTSSESIVSWRMFLFGFCCFVQKSPKRNANTLHFLFYRKILQEVKGEPFQLSLKAEKNGGFETFK